MLAEKKPKNEAINLKNSEKGSGSSAKAICAHPKKWNKKNQTCECPKKNRCFTIGALYDEETCSYVICEKNEKFNTEIHQRIEGKGCSFECKNLNTLHCSGEIF